MTYDVEKIPDYPVETKTMKIIILDRKTEDGKFIVTFGVDGDKEEAINLIRKKTNALQGKFALIPRNQGSKG